MPRKFRVSNHNLPETMASTKMHYMNFTLNMTEKDKKNLFQPFQVPDFKSELSMPTKLNFMICRYYAIPDPC